MDSAAFYDKFIEYQVQSGINDRIYGLYERTCRLGLKPGDDILEIGCGIGTLTYLLLKKVTTGKIDAVDISPASVEFARRHLRADNLTLTAADILHFEPRSKAFDKILVYDVLEHIPVTDHPKLFQQISKWMKEESLLLINFPNPAAILYEQQHDPSGLQETDQPLYTGPLAAAMEAAGIDLLSVETYDVWQKEEYRFIVARKRREFDPRPLSQQRSFLQKGILWMKRKWRKLRHPYPPQK